MNKKKNELKNKLKVVKENVEEIRKTNKLFSNMNNKELSAMLKYKKQKDDGKVPTRKVDMNSLCMQCYTLSTVTYSPYPPTSPMISKNEADRSKINSDKDEGFPVRL